MNVMDFSFNANTFKDMFHNTVAEYLKDEVADKDDVNSPHNLLAAMDQAIDVMVRADADSSVQNNMSAESIGLLEEKDITQIGQHSLDMVVNSLAGYANEVKESHLLAELAGTIKEVIDACDDNIRKDLEQTNMMRPWRILNLNYGIVATRSHQPELIEQAYDALVENLPQDAREFFKEGLQQMDIVGYPEEVREVVERYNKMWGSDSVLH
jgi:hypothetical protein